MRYLVPFTVLRGNELENAEFFNEESRLVAGKVAPLAERYDREVSAGWLLVGALDQAVWLERRYAPGAHLLAGTPQVVTEPGELPHGPAGLAVFWNRLVYACEVLGLERAPFYLGHPPGRAAAAHTAAVLVCYLSGHQGRPLAAEAGHDWARTAAFPEDRLRPRAPRATRRIAVIEPDEVPRDLESLLALADALRADPPALLRIHRREAQQADAEAIRLLALLAVGCGAEVSGLPTAQP